MAKIKNDNDKVIEFWDKRDKQDNTLPIEFPIESEGVLA